MIPMKRHYVIGTAGHIDHGKTSMVKQLTGKDTDWLQEEKERGMTIDLGFAFLGDDITIIDVPGHERFVRNMVAGVSTIDLVLFVIAADDGVMPQTREHLDIIKLLQIKQGIIVITKIDLAEEEWVELVVEDVKDLVKGTVLENAPVVRVSNETGKGIDELKQHIFNNLSKSEDRTDRGIFRLPIDRVFTMKGFGTVVAGTVLSGTLSPDQTIELLPQKIKLRVRGLQIHEQNVTTVKIGDRAAVNLVGIEKEAISRGDVLAAPDTFRPTRFFDGKFYLLESAPRNLKNTARIRLNMGTSEVIGRVSILDKDEIKPGESAYIQFRLEKPIVPDIGDRYVVRTYSPIITIGGGVVLDVNPRRHKRFAKEVLQKIAIIEIGDPEQIIEQLLSHNGYRSTNLKEIAQQVSLPLDKVEKVMQSLEKKKQCFQYIDKGQVYYIHYNFYSRLKDKINDSLKNFHQKNPTRRGITKTDLKVLINLPVNALLFNKILEEMVNEQEVKVTDNRVALATHKLQVTEQQRELMDKVEQIYYEEGFVTSDIAKISEKVGLSEEDGTEIVQILIETDTLRKVDEGIIFHKKRIDEASRIIMEFFKTHEQLTVGDFRQMIDTSRKYAVPLLNYFDALGLTVRQQDVRVINPDYHE